MRVRFFIAIWGALVFHTAVCRADTVETVATATVLDNLILTSLQPLYFGRLTPTGGGTVTVSIDNTRTIQGGVHVDNDFMRGAFMVKGTPNNIYAISTPNEQTFVSDETSSDPSLINTLIVNAFQVLSMRGATNNGSGSLDSNGEDQVYVGGTITVPDNAVPGVYSGLVQLTVSY